MLISLRRAKLDVLFGAILAAVGIALWIIGAWTVTGEGQFWIAGVGIACALIGVSELIWGSLSWYVRHKQTAHRHGGYGCPRCGYRPTDDDQENGVSFPCPRCGRPVYKQ